MGDNYDSKIAYQIMKAVGLPVIPVYQATHITTNDVGKIIDVQPNTIDLDILDYYAEQSDYIAIGGTAISKVKGYTKNKRIQIVQNILGRHPNKKFHLLGTVDPYIIQKCQQLHSVDGQAWLAKTRKEQKIIESVCHLVEKKEWFNSTQQLMLSI
jgi:hypothetical protein